MVRRGNGRRRPAGAAALFTVTVVVTVVLGPLAGCLPPRNESGEPLEPVPGYVRSVRIDPRTLKPIEEGPAAGESSRGGEDAPSPR